GLVESMHELLGNELPCERLDLLDAQTREVRLVLPRRVDAADRQIAGHEQQERERLPRALLAAQQQIPPEGSFGAPRDERAVDVEDREPHRFCPIVPRISSFCDFTNSTMTGNPRTMQSSTER